MEQQDLELERRVWQRVSGAQVPAQGECTSLREMEQRDYNDTHRAAAPLRPADDAIMIDNTDMDFAASLELLLDVIRGSVEQ